MTSEAAKDAMNGLEKHLYRMFPSIPARSAAVLVIESTAKNSYILRYDIKCWDHDRICQAYGLRRAVNCRCLYVFPEFLYALVKTHLQRQEDAPL